MPGSLTSYISARTEDVSVAKRTAIDSPQVSAIPGVEPAEWPITFRWDPTVNGIRRCAPRQLFDDAVVRNGLSDERVGARHSAANLGSDFVQANEPVRFASRIQRQIQPSAW